MQITREDVIKIAHLARLNIGEKDIVRYQGHLNQILEYVQKLNELDTEKTEPMYFVRSTENTCREDVEKPSLPREEAIKNAPSKGGGFIRVPRVIRTEGEEF